MPSSSTLRHATILACTLVTSSTANAHMSLEAKSAPPGTYKAVFGVPHGCKGSPTTKVTITIPEGIIGVKPMPKPGWTVSVTKGPYARTYDYFHGMKLSDGVTEVVWSGGQLDDGHFDEFTLVGFISDAFKAGDGVYFPARQDCIEGNVSWTEIPAVGTDPHALKSPAPSLRILAAAYEHAHHAAAKSPQPIGIDQAWARATPEGASVGAGYLKIRNTSGSDDKLIGAKTNASDTTEIHEMKMDGDVMKMRRVEIGVPVAAGGEIELKPGGLHLMLLNLKSPLAEGSTIDGELEFEKAGKVPFKLDVRAIGAQGDHKHAH